jgi:hypothetical protein
VGHPAPSSASGADESAAVADRLSFPLPQLRQVADERSGDDGMSPVSPFDIGDMPELPATPDDASSRASLPPLSPEAVDFVADGRRYWYDNGHWYAEDSSGWSVARPPWGSSFLDPDFVRDSMDRRQAVLLPVRRVLRAGAGRIRGRGSRFPAALRDLLVEKGNTMKLIARGATVALLALAVSGVSAAQGVVPERDSTKVDAAQAQRAPVAGTPNAASDAQDTNAVSRSARKPGAKSTGAATHDLLRQHHTRPGDAFWESPD